MKHWTIASSVPLHLLARASLGPKKVQQYWKRNIGHTIWPWKIPSLLLCERGKYNYRSQTTCCHFQKGCSYIITKTPVNSMRMCQYRVEIIHKPGSVLFMTGWLSRHNHSENKDKEITSFQISINTIQSTTCIQEYMTMHELQEAASQDQHLQHLMEYVIQWKPESKNQQPKDIRTYWRFRGDMAVVDGVVIKDKQIVILEALQQQALKQLHINHMGIKKLNAWHANLFIG